MAQPYQLPLKNTKTTVIFSPIILANEFSQFAQVRVHVCITVWHNYAFNNYLKGISQKIQHFQFSVKGAKKYYTGLQRSVKSNYLQIMLVVKVNRQLFRIILYMCGYVYYSLLQNPQSSWFSVITTASNSSAYITSNTNTLSLLPLNQCFVFNLFIFF